MLYFLATLVIVVSMKSVQKWQNLPLIAWLLPASVLGYLPVITLGVVEGVHIDVSLLYLLLLVSVIASLKPLYDARRIVWSHIAVKALISFSGIMTVSLLWTENIVRGVVTVGFMWLLTLLVLEIIALWPKITANKALLVRFSLIAVAGTCLAAIWQLLTDALGLRSLSFLPEPYTGDVFGIARPTAFALEPQFLGSLLLIPFGYLIHTSLRDTRLTTNHAFLLLVSFVLIMTISRGAAIGALVIITVLLILSRARYSAVTRVVGVGIVSICVSLLTVLSLGSIRAGSIEGGQKSAAAFIEQYTLGTVRLRMPDGLAPVATTPSKSGTENQLGYVPTSTSSRLTMSDLAVNIWQTSPVYGVGVGAYGANASRISEDYSRGTIANNYYLETLAELGVIGFGIFVLFIASLLISLYRARLWLPIALLLGTMIQMYFFSGNANIVHIWLLIAVCLSLIIHPKNHKRPV